MGDCDASGDATAEMHKLGCNTLHSSGIFSVMGTDEPAAVGRPTLEEFVAARSLALLRSAYLLVGSQAGAEDLVQSALVKCLPRWNSVNEHEGYVRRTMFTTYLGWRRGRQWQSEVPLNDTSPVAAEGDIPALIAQRRDLVTAMGSLAPRQRAVIVMRYLEDRSDTDIAATLGIAPATVRSQAMREL